MNYRLGWPWSHRVTITLLSGIHDEVVCSGRVDSYRVSSQQLALHVLSISSIDLGRIQMYMV